ncbi:hypothetical protein B0H19DRAFT_1255832 [Mycena capillaripes]|nr:hypothetical protein B0H19DRAFT_1255832 [Mycena capillaripes]
MRKDQTQKQVNAFAEQIPQMTDTYLGWDLAVGDGGLDYVYKVLQDAVVEERCSVHVEDVFSVADRELVLLVGDPYMAAACVHHGWMPVSPYMPSVVITLCALEVYRVAHLRCPQLGIQAFVRTLSNIHGVALCPWLGTQFSVAFNVYLAICKAVDKHVQVALGQDTKNWRLKNVCSACMYKIEGEPILTIPFMSTFDGNNSLACFELHERKRMIADGLTVPEVDLWAKDGMDDLMKSFVPSARGGGEEDGCLERWQNMKEDVTACAWGMYDETGIFPALCCHSFVLVVVDMIKSGESKYGFAVTTHLLRVLGEVANGKLAANNNFKLLVGVFHGHGHNCCCQLDNLSTYVKGVGLEPLEGCESFFSKLNALASTTCYASQFHQRQVITTYMKHTDTFDTYQNLSLLMCNRYQQALGIKATEPALQDTMQELGVKSRNEFEGWLAKEKVHLRTLSKESLHETLEMEYYQKLVRAMMGVMQPFMPASMHSAYAKAAEATRRIETQRQHVLEQQSRMLDAMQDLKLRLGVGAQWVEGDNNWVAAATLVCRHRYQRALDNLEGLIIAHIFELSKCHMSGTGYKLCKHITKALQARSKAVKTAIAGYNTAANAMDPPMPTLDWEQVMECAFLSDFDLLHKSREDIQAEPWALPSGHYHLGAPWLTNTSSCCVLMRRSSGLT